MERSVSVSQCYSDTIEYAKKLAADAAPGDIICLDGDLGVGKTVFAKGFAEGLGITEPITSPTFTIMNIYDDPSYKLPLYHYDVYRIEDESGMDELGYEEYFFGEGVCLIEWAKQIEDVIPQNAVHIEIKKDPSKGDNYREIIRY